MHPDAVPTTLGALLERTVARCADREAIVAGDRRLTYRECRDLVRRVAWGLYRIGVRHGGHVAILMENRAEWVIVEMAATMLGAVIVPVNTRYRRDEIEYVLRQSDADTLIMVDRFLGIDFLATIEEMCPELSRRRPGELAAERLPTLRRVVGLGHRRLPGMFAYDKLMGSAPPPGAVDALAAVVSPDDVALMIYTSGTTAFPKGVMLTHGQITRNMYEGRVAQEDLGPDDRMLVVAPFVHIVGGMNSVVGMLHVGGCLVVLDRFDPDVVLRTMEQERITRFYGATPMFIDLLGAPTLGRYDTSTLRRFTIFPGPFQRAFLEELLGALHADGVHIGYGLTETTNGVAFVASWRDGVERVATTVGRPRTTYELRIADPDTGVSLGPGGGGEIQVRGFVVMKGYYALPEETAQVIDGRGWFHTGDLGSVDDDGYLHFLGRLKDMIKTSGFNVACQEVELVLGQHAAVQQVALVGIPDRRDTEVGAAFVQLREGAVCSEAELVEFARARLARFKVPRHVRWVKEFPLSSSGKIQKFVLRRQLVDELGLEG
jgi:fatty-acyl-CoA synthase